MTTFRDNLFAGKTAFVAGGTSGINLGIAKRFAQLGAKVAGFARPDSGQPLQGDRKDQERIDGHDKGRYGNHRD